MSALYTLPAFLDQLRRAVRIDVDAAFAILDFLKYASFPILTVAFVGWIGTIILSWRSWLKLFKKISKKAWIIFGALFILAVLSRFVYMPHHPQVYYDEASFIMTAEGYYHFGLNVMLDRHHPYTTFICPSGWAYLVSLAFRVLGPQIESAFNLSAGLSVLTALFVFLIVFLLFENEKAALWSTAIFVVYPVYTRLSTSSAMGTSTLFFLTFSFLAMLMYLKEYDRRLLYMTFFGMGFLVNTRQECFMTVVPLLLIFFVLFHKEPKKEFKNYHIYVCLIMLLIFTVPAFLSSFYGVSVGFYYFYEPQSKIRDHIMGNLHYNLAYWIENRIQPLSVFIMAVAGMWMALKKRKRLAWYFIGWFAFLQLFYSINPSCDFGSVRTLDSWKNAINQIFVVVLFSGLTPAFITAYFKKNIPRLVVPVTILLAVVIAIIPFRFHSFTHRKTIWCKEYLFVKRVTKSLPDNSLMMLDVGYDAVLGGKKTMMVYASETPIKYLADLDPDRPKTWRKPLKEYHRWKKLNKGRVYLFLNAVNTAKDQKKIDWYFKTFKLDMVDGYGLSRQKAGFVIYEIKDVHYPPIEIWNRIRKSYGSDSRGDE